MADISLPLLQLFFVKALMISRLVVASRHFIRSEGGILLNNNFFHFVIATDQQFRVSVACADVQHNSQVKLGSGIFNLLTDFFMASVFYLLQNG